MPGPRASTVTAGLLTSLVPSAVLVLGAVLLRARRSGDAGEERPAPRGGTVVHARLPIGAPVTA